MKCRKVKCRYSKHLKRQMAWALRCDKTGFNGGSITAVFQGFNGTIIWNIVRSFLLHTQGWKFRRMRGKILNGFKKLFPQAGDKETLVRPLIRFCMVDKTGRLDLMGFMVSYSIWYKIGLVKCCRGLLFKLKIFNQ